MACSTWQAGRSAYHADRFFIQIADKYIPPGLGTALTDHWIEEDQQGRVTLYGVRMSGSDRQFYMKEGSLVEAGPLDPKPYDNPVFTEPVDWSIVIDSSTNAAPLYEGPEATGNMYVSMPLNPTRSWHLRFFLSDFTSSGFPGGDNSLNLYSFSVVPAPGALLLGSVGLAFSSWKLRRRRTI